jgi:hypothetical protein
VLLRCLRDRAKIPAGDLVATVCHRRHDLSIRNRLADVGYTQWSVKLVGIVSSYSHKVRSIIQSQWLIVH